jgi:iron-sulfur cluster insertion protein
MADNCAMETILPSYQDLEQPLDFTAAAARKVAALIAEEGNPALKLRVYISGGGCSGFQYGFSFDEERAEDDLALERDGVTLLVDPLSLQYLMGAEVDYRESLQGCAVRHPQSRTRRAPAAAAAASPCEYTAPVRLPARRPRARRAPARGRAALPACGRARG